MARENKRYSILQKDTTKCLICGNSGRLQWHEVFFGTDNRQKSIDNGCCVIICYWCHKKIHHDSYGVNSNGYKLNYNLKKAMQRKFEENHSRDEFMNIFHKNYL